MVPSEVRSDKPSTKPASERTGEKSAKKPQKPLRRINPDTAGIDIGGKEHYVAVPEDRDAQPVRTFGCYNPDLREMALWLKGCGITSVAMESTGVFWVPVFRVLEEHGLEVRLVHARYVKAVPGRKTDVLDCQWLQQLHSYGLLSSCFVVSDEIDELRSLWRHRASVVEDASRQIQLMQKAFEQMNIHLHKVIKDITGKTGLSIIRAIVAGERDPWVLAKYRDPGCKSSVETIIKALSGNWRKAHLFTLKQALESYDFYHGQMAACDQQIYEAMKALPSKTLESPPPKTKPKATRRKNEPYFDVQAELFQKTGVDLTAIDGIKALTALTIVTECGTDMSAFATEKHFASWLCLCPNNRVTGGKVKRRSTRKTANRAALALRLAAQSLHRSNSALGAYLRRMRARLGAPKAITATAHRLARLVYRMLRYGAQYVDMGTERYEQQVKERELKSIAKRAQTLGYSLVNTTDGVCVS